MRSIRILLSLILISLVALLVSEAYYQRLNPNNSYQFIFYEGPVTQNRAPSEILKYKDCISYQIPELPDPPQLPVQEIKRLKTTDDKALDLVIMHYIKEMMNYAEANRKTIDKERKELNSLCDIK